MADTLSIASWNINSVRARIDIVERFLTEEAPDILCLQETKVVNEIFPTDMFKRLGYVHQVLNGQRMHHGVAIMSKVPIHEDDRFDWQANGEARHVGIRLDNGVRIENVYVPAGSIPPVHQKANSVMIGIWSDGFSQLRAGSTTRWATALSATSLVIHIWSRRRPRSDAAQSFAR